jgi:hypothetical protein
LHRDVTAAYVRVRRACYERRAAWQHGETDRLPALDDERAYAIRALNELRAAVACTAEEN